MKSRSFTFCKVVPLKNSKKRSNCPKTYFSILPFFSPPPFPLPLLPFFLPLLSFLFSLFPNHCTQLSPLCASILSSFKSLYLISPFFFPFCGGKVFFLFFYTQQKYDYVVSYCVVLQKKKKNTMEVQLCCYGLGNK